VWLRNHNIKPWEIPLMPVGVVKWLDSIDSVLTAVENGA